MCSTHCHGKFQKQYDPITSLFITSALTTNFNRALTDYFKSFVLFVFTKFVPVNCVKSVWI